ncbi:MAG: tetratricopeptide repeat protein [Comamonadaceae bacterium]|nr:MAG: tetratricopeptide repeat protein [Comamonadaceae bacterium]
MMRLPRFASRFSPRLLLVPMLVAALGANAQTAVPEGDPAAEVSALDGELFYQLLLGEINARGGEPGAGYALILDAARKTNDAKLYQRAADIALQNRSGEPALQAARAWRQAMPTSREANRYVLQILIALNRVPESMEPLKNEIVLAEPGERAAVMTAIARSYARVTDKKQAAVIVETALGDYLRDPKDPAVAAAGWTTIGRLRMAAGDTPGTIDAASRAQNLDLSADGAAILALELMDPKVPQAEPIVKKYLAGSKPMPELRMGYARALLDTQRYTEAAEQARILTTERPTYPEAWLILGTLQLQENQNQAAEVSLRKYVELAQSQPASDERRRGQAQAYLALSQIAEKRKDFTAAEAWIDRIENSQDLIAAQNRRASILARQGKMAEARQLIRNIPERNPTDARMKLSAEVQLLRDGKLFQPAYDLLAAASAKDPKDTDLVYDQAMMAEKLGNLPEMERLLRKVIADKPEYHHAYNALGYSLADRNTRLPEARTLIQKALEFAPGDPFISDSLAWVEFRMGNKAEALKILDVAYKARPDAEIAAHLGEVLWSMGQRDRATAIWKEGLLINAENETLQETLKRLRVKP